MEAAKELTVNVVVNDDAFPDLDEFAQLEQSLAPFLDGIPPAELDAKSISYLAGKTQINPTTIAYFVQSHKLATTSDIKPETYYGLLRSSTNLPSLLSQDADTQKKLLEQAYTANIISETATKDVDGVIKSLTKKRVERLLRQPDLPDGTTSLGAILDVAGIDQNRKEAFAEKFAAFNGTSEAFWEALASDDAFGGDDDSVESVKLSIHLGMLTGNNEPLMRALHTRLTKNGEDLRALVGKSESEWLREIREHTDENGNVRLLPNLPDVEGQSPEETYASTIMRTMEVNFPTATVAARLGRSDFNGAANVKDFLDRHRDIELRDQNLREFIAENDSSLSADARNEVYAFKRIFDLAPGVERYRAMQPLLRDQLSSASAIRSMGETTFLKRYANEIGSEAATHIYRAASHKTAVATSLYAANSPVINNLGLRVIPDGDLRTVFKKSADNLSVGTEYAGRPVWQFEFL